MCKYVCIYNRQGWHDRHWEVQENIEILRDTKSDEKMNFSCLKRPRGHPKGSSENSVRDLHGACDPHIEASQWRHGSEFPKRLPKERSPEFEVINWCRIFFTSKNDLEINMRLKQLNGVFFTKCHQMILNVTRCQISNDSDQDQENNSLQQSFWTELSCSCWRDGWLGHQHTMIWRHWKAALAPAFSLPWGSTWSSA